MNNDVAKVLAEAEPKGLCPKWCDDRRPVVAHSHDLLKALTAAGYVVVAVPEGVVLTHGARLEQVGWVHPNTGKHRSLVPWFLHPIDSDVTPPRPDDRPVYAFEISQGSELKWNCDDCEAPTIRPGLCDHCERCIAGSDCAEEECQVTL